MAETAGRVVIEMLARVDKAEADLKRFGTTFDMTGRRVASAANDVEKSSSRIANATRNLGFQISDVGVQLAGGQSPFLIISQQAPQVVQALEDISLSGARLSTVLKSIALPGFLALASALVTIVPSMLGLDDAQKKSGKSAKTLEESIHDLNIALNKEVQTSEQARVQTLKNAQADVTAAIKKREKIKAILAEQLALANASVPQGPRGEGPNAGAALVQDLARSKAADLQRQIAAEDAAIAEAKRNVTLARIPILQAQVVEATDKAAAATARYEREVARLNETYKGNQDDKAYVAALTAATRRRDAELQAITAVRRADSAAAAERVRNAKADAKAWDEVLLTARNIGVELGKATSKLDIGSYKEEWKAFLSEIDAQRRDQFAGTMEAAQPQLDVDRQLQRQREEGMRDLAGLYYDLFSGGTKAIVADFKRLLFQALAEAAAKQTLGSLLGIASKATSFLSGGFSLAPTALAAPNLSSSLPATSLPGRASGGHVAAGKLYRVNEGASAGRVEAFRPQGSGTIIPLGQVAAAQRGGSTYNIYVSADHSVTPAGFADDLAGKILAQARAMDAVAADAGARLGAARMQRNSKYRLGR
jgi:hypothetical protein